MDEEAVLDRIDRWQTAGLIDAATADRLRAAEAAGPTRTVQAPADAAPAAPSAIGSAVEVFGPGVTVVEMFAYLGTAFLLAAVAAFFARIGSGSVHAQAILGAGAGVEAVLLAVIGLVLRSGTPRRRRGAGIAFVASVVAVGSAVSLIGGTVGLDGAAQAIVTAAVAGAAALVFRLLLPSLTTELAILVSITTLSSSLLAWIESVVVPPPIYFGAQPALTPTPTGPDPLILVVGAAVWWLATAFLFGVVALIEAHRGRRDPSAQRRAGVVRLWAGLTAVLGLFYAVSEATYSGTGPGVRSVEPVIGDLAVLVLAAILAERAYRRESSAFVFAAAAGCIVALSDLDASYLGGTPDVGLLLEGAILLGVGMAAETLRRRVSGRVPGRPTPGAAA